MDDDLVCEYDSTWDTESDGDELENTGRSKKTRPAFVCSFLSLINVIKLVQDVGFISNQHDDKNL